MFSDIIYITMKQTLSLEHNYKAPANPSEASPVIIMLHGFGSDENDLFSFAGELPDHYTIISLKAPIKMQPYGNAWYNIYFDNTDGKFSDTNKPLFREILVVNALMRSLKSTMLIKTMLHFLGFSQGTILSFAVALSYPEKVKNVIGLSGYINEDILVKGYAENDFSKLNVYSSHGSVDMVIPVTWAQRTKPFLKRLNIALYLFRISRRSRSGTSKFL